MASRVEILVDSWVGAFALGSVVFDATAVCRAAISAENHKQKLLGLAVKDYIETTYRSIYDKI